MTHMNNDKKTKSKFRIEKENSSGLSAFIKRPVPSENEVADFEEVLDQEVRHQEIDANLNEIYSNKKGDLINVTKMEKRLRSSLIVRIFKKLTLVVFSLLLIYFAYLNFFAGDSDMNAIILSIDAPETVLSGEDFSYVVTYKNQTKYAISNVKLELKYPQNFVFQTADPQASSFNNSFDLPGLAPGAQGEVLINGSIIDKPQSVNVVSASLHYMPVNFSSQFKKESSIATIVDGFGFDVDVDFPNLVFLGQSNDIEFSFDREGETYLNDFIIEFSVPKSAKLSLAPSQEDDANEALNTEGANSWSINLNDLENKNVIFKYLVNEADIESELKVKLKKRIEDGQTYDFYERSLAMEAVKSDLNITLLLDGEKNNQAVNFAEELNYTLSYTNNGEKAYENAVITAVLEGAWFDFDTLDMEVEGDLRSNQIIWNEQDIEALKSIEPGDSGEINFSIELKEYSDELASEDMQVSVYSQYGGETTSEDSSNKSNIIESALNSNLTLEEEIRYFDEDNIPVGSGPLPPRVNETTTFRVYLNLENDIHELRETEVRTKLPEYLEFVEANRVSVGNLYFDEEENEVVWDIGRLPTSVESANSSYTISLTPRGIDRNKILVLSTGAEVRAVDTNTKEEIGDKSGAKTTKLEDDEIAALNNSGRIE